MTKKTTEDILQELLSIINPLMIMITLYDTLELFVKDCNYDGLTISEQLDIIRDYYELYDVSTDQQKQQLRIQIQKEGVSPIYLSDFYIHYHNELNTMQHQNTEENIDYMDALREEIQNPEELIENVQEYTKSLSEE